MNISCHAELRMNQRGITPLMIDLLKEFGAVQYHGGSEVLTPNKAYKRELKKYCGSKIAQVVLAGHPPYIVINEDTLVTTARKTKRFKKDRR